MSSQKPGAIIIGGGVTGLSTLSALAPLGIPVSIISLNPDGIAHHSRLSSEHNQLYEFRTRPESLLELLESQSDKWGGQIILTNYDEVTKLLSQNRELLERWYRITAPPREITRYLLQKDLTYEIACEL